MKILLLAFLSQPTLAGTEAGLELCAPGSVEAQTALDAVAAYDERIRGSAPWDPFEDDLRQAWHGLFDLPCLQGASAMRDELESALEVSTRPPSTPPAVRILQDWWVAGGGDWLKWRTGSQGAQFLQLPPGVVHPLEADHRLQSQLCPPLDRACIEPTEAFRARAAEILPVLSPDRIVGIYHESPSDDLAELCARVVAAGDEPDSFLAWSACLEEQQPKREALPPEALRVPESGWLLLTYTDGRDCSQRAFLHLQTGSAWITRSCAESRRGLAVGTAPRELVQELAWNLAQTLMIRVVPAGKRDLPIPEQWTDHGRPARWGTVGGGLHRGALLVWAWVDEGEVIAEGILPEARPSHVLRPLDALWEGLDRGCPAVALPAPNYFGEPPRTRFSRRGPTTERPMRQLTYVFAYRHEAFASSTRRACWWRLFRQRAR